MSKISNIVHLIKEALIFVLLCPFVLFHMLFGRPSQTDPRKWVDDFHDLPLCGPHGSFKPSYDLSEPMSLAAASGDAASVRELVSAGCLPPSSKELSVVHAACAFADLLVLAELSALPKSFWLAPLAKTRRVFRGWQEGGEYHVPTDSPFTLLQARPDGEEALLAALSHEQWSRADASNLTAKAGLRMDVLRLVLDRPVSGKLSRMVAGGGVELWSSDLLFDEIELRRTISHERIILEKSLGDSLPSNPSKKNSARL